MCFHSAGDTPTEAAGAVSMDGLAPFYLRTLGCDFTCDSVSTSINEATHGIAVRNEHSKASEAYGQQLLTNVSHKANRMPPALHWSHLLICFPHQTVSCLRIGACGATFGLTFQQLVELRL